MNVFSHYSVTTTALFVTAAPPTPVCSKIVSIVISDLPAT